MEDTKLSYDQWMSEARKAGKHWWCYEEFVDDNPDAAKAAWQAGEDPYDYIKEAGEDLDLSKWGPAWGSW